MRKLILLAMLIAGVQVFATSSQNLKIVTLEGSDGAPWPFVWGAECPFPWDSIEGEWIVEGAEDATHTGDYLVFTAEEDVENGKLLFIEHHNKKGEIVGRGTGYADTTNKVTKALISGLAASDRYKLLVRSYTAPKTKKCGSRQVMAVTFCPVRGKKCMETSNYTLSR